MTSPRKKLIEVALPLDAINAASAREKKSIRHGHPSTLYLWWARRPAAELSERRDKKKRPLRGVGPEMLSPAG